jgi:hypothetical protein
VMLREQRWKWRAGFTELELRIEYNGGDVYIWLERENERAASMVFSDGSSGVEPRERRFEPWPEEVQRQFDFFVAAARKSVR